MLCGGGEGHFGHLGAVQRLIDGGSGRIGGQEEGGHHGAPEGLAVPCRPTGRALGKGARGERKEGGVAQSSSTPWEEIGEDGRAPWEEIEGGVVGGRRAAAAGRGRRRVPAQTWRACRDPTEGAGTVLMLQIPPHECRRRVTYV